MPSIPEKKNLTASAADVVNSIRREVGGTFADQVPAAINEGQELSDGTVATREMALGTLRQIGNVITTFQPLANAFLSALVNRIGRVIINSKLYSNPWAGFKRGLLEYGETIEELFVNIVQAQDFDPETAENEVFKRKIPDVRSAFHTMNYQKFYKTTVNNDQLRQAFLSFEGISDLIEKITEALYTSANYDEYLVMKYMLCYAMEHGAFHPVTIAQPTATNSNSVVTTLKATSEKLQFLSADYNQAGVYNHTPKGDQYFIMTADFSSIVDVETLARAFNIDKVTLMGHTVIIDQFTFTTSETARLQELLGTQYTALTTSLFADVPCVCVDRDFFMIFDNYQNMTEQYNGEGLYWNYWLHQWKTFSTSPFANAVIFTDETPAVSTVAVTPSALTMGKGTSTQFTATVTNAGFASTGVTWSISGQQSANTRIDGQGRLYIAQDESATTITVKATSVFDTGKSNTATVTVSAS